MCGGVAMGVVVMGGVVCNGWAELQDSVIQV